MRIRACTVRLCRKHATFVRDLIFFRRSSGNSDVESEMVKLGYKLMSEEHGPADLVRNAQDAEEAWFHFAAISDHYSRGSRSRAMRRSPGPCWARSRRRPGAWG